MWFNEIHYDNDGADADEGFELAAAAGTDLTGWTVVLYNGNGGAPYATINVLATFEDQSNGFGFVWVPAVGLQNGAPDGLALVAPDGAGGECVVQFLSYEGGMTAVGGPANGLSSVDIGVVESSTTPLGESLQLSGEGTHYSDFTWVAPAAATMGNVNAGQTFPVAAPPVPTGTPTA